MCIAVLATRWCCAKIIVSISVAKMDYYIPLVEEVDSQRRERNIFERGQSHFPDFFPGVKYLFPVENSHFGTPKTHFSGFESE